MNETIRAWMMIGSWIVTACTLTATVTWFVAKAWHTLDRIDKRTNTASRLATLETTVESLVHRQVIEDEARAERTRGGGDR